MSNEKLTFVVGAILGALMTWHVFSMGNQNIPVNPVLFWAVVIPALPGTLFGRLVLGMEGQTYIWIPAVFSSAPFYGTMAWGGLKLTLKIKAWKEPGPPKPVN